MKFLFMKFQKTSEKLIFDYKKVARNFYKKILEKKEKETVFKHKQFYI